MDKGNLIDGGTGPKRNCELNARYVSLNFNVTFTWRPPLAGKSCLPFINYYTQSSLYYANHLTRIEHFNTHLDYVVFYALELMDTSAGSGDVTFTATCSRSKDDGETNSRISFLTIREGGLESTCIYFLC